MNILEHVFSCTQTVIRSSLVYMPRRKTGILPPHSVMSLESCAASQNMFCFPGVKEPLRTRLKSQGRSS